VAVKRKLIEVSIPLDEINKQSAREKSIRHGHPSTLHLWWSRKPLATSRAVLFAQLVDDPSNDTDSYVREAIARGYEDPAAWADQRVKQERERLFELIRRMVDWDNLADEGLYEAVRAEIHRSTGGNPPPILDPFAGGGSIPLEAQRLGLEVLASDLNPVSVLINKAMVELPAQFAGGAPVYPGADATRNYWPRASGLAEDVRRYGEWLRDEAEHRIGDQYPKATLSDGSEAGVIAWIWARTVACPNPACGIDMPLVNSWWLGKKKGKESYVVPVVEESRVHFQIGHDLEAAPRGDTDGTMSGRHGAVCVACGASAGTDYIKSEGVGGRMRSALMATDAEGNWTRPTKGSGTTRARYGRRFTDSGRSTRYSPIGSCWLSQPFVISLSRPANASCLMLPSRSKTPKMPPDMPMRWQLTWHLWSRASRTIRRRSRLGQVTRKWKFFATHSLVKQFQ
jgi:putative DNA methylase